MGVCILYLYLLLKPSVITVCVHHTCLDNLYSSLNVEVRHIENSS